MYTYRNTVQDIKGHHNKLSDLNEQHHTPAMVFFGTRRNLEALLVMSWGVLGLTVESKINTGTLNQSTGGIPIPQIPMFYLLINTFFS